MEVILRDFYTEFLLQVNGEHLCKELEDRSLVINMDTANVRDKSRASKTEGNDKLYNIICRKIIFGQLVDLLQCMAASGNYDLAQKIVNKHRDVLPQSFHLEEVAGTLFDSGPRNAMIIYAKKLEMNGHHNTLNAQLGETGADSQNMESDASIECDYYELEDETDGPRNVH